MNDFDIVTSEVLAKANRPTNSGYLSVEHQQTNIFPCIQQHHFRIEDDKTILELQKLYLQSKPQQINYKQESHSQFSNKMNSLISLLDSNAPLKFQNQKLSLGNTYYSLQDTEFNPDLSYKQMLQRLNTQNVREGIQKINIGDAPSSNPINPTKFKKRGDMNGLVKKMNKLQIAQY